MFIKSLQIMGNLIPLVFIIFEIYLFGTVLVRISIFCLHLLIVSKLHYLVNINFFYDVDFNRI